MQLSLKIKKYLKKIKLLINQHKNNSLFFIHNNIGYNYGLLNTNAAIGYVQLKKIKSILLKKKKYLKIIVIILINLKNLKFSKVSKIQNQIIG